MRRVNAFAFLATAFLSLFAGSCGDVLSGHTYHNNGGVVQVEFKSGGKALVSTGNSGQTCSYSESGKIVRLVCKDGTLDLTIQEDGALVGPANSLMARLTPAVN